MNAVTSVAWISRGISKSHPTQAEVNENDLKRLLQGERGDDVTDNDSEDDDDAVACYSNNAEDPYLNKDISESDEDEAVINPEDNIIAVSRVKEEEFCLDAWVYNESEKNIYCHHEYILMHCPLVVEWVGFDLEGTSNKNYVAVGTMSPNIELWNFDVMNSIEPAVVLAGKESKKKPAEKKKRKTTNDGHSDAVLGLSWNKLQEHVLASASADSCIGIWDLNASTCVKVKSLHSDKVQALQWHPFENQMLLSGSLDQHVKVIDCRSPQGSQKAWKLAGGVEKVLWNTHNASSFYACTDKGHVFCYDVRTDEPVFELQAHSSSVTSLSQSPTIEGCLITSSEDQSVKVWDVRSVNPTLVEQKKCKIGSLFCAAACPDSQILLCVGGEREMRVIDMKRHVEYFDGHDNELQEGSQQVAENKRDRDVKPKMSAKASKVKSKSSSALQKKKNKLSKSKKK